jgi:hypothetical protein
MQGMLMVLLVTIHNLNREKAYAERFDKSRDSMRAFRGAWRAFLIDIPNHIASIQDQF